MALAIGDYKMTIKLSSKGGGIPNLAPDLNFPSSKSSGISTYKRITAIDASSGLTTALSVSGKFILDALRFSSITSPQTMTVKLTIDGDIKWNDVAFSFASGSTLSLISPLSTTDGAAERYQVNSTLLLEVETDTDTSITLDYQLRPIN